MSDTRILNEPSTAPKSSRVAVPNEAKTSGNVKLRIIAGAIILIVIGTLQFVLPDNLKVICTVAAATVGACVMALISTMVDNNGPFKKQSNRKAVFRILAAFITLAVVFMLWCVLPDNMKMVCVVATTTVGCAIIGLVPNFLK